MPEFTYTAKDRAGRTVEGTIFADNSALAAGKVREMGYFPEKVRAVDVRAVSGGIGRRFAENFVYPVVSGVPLKDLAVFYRQFATLINAGMPLYQSLVALEGQTGNAKLKGILRDCQRQAMAGGRLSDVFAQYNWVFSDLQIEMIRAAEQGGLLDQMLNRIADYLEQELALRRLISRLTLYPKLVALSALFLLGKSFFTDFTPALSKLIIGMMGVGKNDYTGWDYLNDTVFFLFWLALFAFAAVAFCRIFLFQSETAQEGYERVKMAIPGLGTVARQFALAKFGRAFGAMYAGGLPLNTAIRVGGDASGSKMISRATRRAMAAAERGAPLSQAFRETGVFPPLVLDMLHTGEQTGNIDAMMQKVAEYLESEAESRAHAYSHIFATAVYLVVAFLVGMAVIRFYMNYASGAMTGGMGGAGGE
jgi:type II secretory pathway component PulF